MTHIEGLRHEESDYLLKFLSDHVTKGGDFHARYKWSEGDICVWDQVRDGPLFISLSEFCANITIEIACVHPLGHS